MRTLKVISYRATHSLSFLIIIMVINVYKLKSLSPDERSAEARLRESAPTGLMPWVMALEQASFSCLSLLSLPSPLHIPSLLAPRAPLGTKCPGLAEVGGAGRAGAEAGTPDCVQCRHKVGAQ